VVIPGHNSQDRLDLTLAALSRQTYPAGLLEVVVVDDGSAPPLRLPDLRPANCRIVPVTEGWGIANAVNTGARHATGEILHRLDADMVTEPTHVEALARWHHVTTDAVTLGYKRFVNDGWPTPADIVRHCDEGTLEVAFATTEPHDYIEKIIERTDLLRGGDHLNFRVHVGATVAMHREFFLDTGGLNTDLVLGEDTEFGFRLAQAGALFIPEPRARSWHLGPSSMMQRGEELRRFNQPHLADLMPQPRWLRKGAGRVWRVPLVTAVVPAEGSFELVSTCVDHLLGNDEHDLRVVLVGPWDDLTDGRRTVLTDPLLDLRLLAATYRSEPRVVLATEAPSTVFPSPYRLDVAAGTGVAPSTVGDMVAQADRDRLGLLGTADRRLVLWRTAAVSRALRTLHPGESLVDAVTDVYGQGAFAAAGVVDLSALPAGALRSPTSLSQRHSDVVVVGGARSLLKAAAMVARKSLRR
jgi:GT2 family glycosyltransferase